MAILTSRNTPPSGRFCLASHRSDGADVREMQIMLQAGTESLSTRNWSKANRGKNPVNCVTWNEAHAYCRWADKRLPRSKNGSTARWWSPAVRHPGERSRHCLLACWNRRDGTCTAPALLRVLLGLYEMAGNLVRVGSRLVRTVSASASARYAGPVCLPLVAFVRGGSWFDHDDFPLGGSSRLWQRDCPHYSNRITDAQRAEKQQSKNTEQSLRCCRPDESYPRPKCMLAATD